MSVYMEGIIPEPWTREALCATTNPDAWFPERDKNASAAIKICRKCPVVAECLEFALRTNQTDGIWGGMGVTARGRLRRAAA